MSPRPDLSMSYEDALAFLEQPHAGVLSTIGPGGFPHSVGIYYVSLMRESLQLHMWVYGKSQKARNVERDPRASVLVESGDPYVDLRGVLARGRARVERDPEAVFELGQKIYERYFLPRTGIALADGPVENVRRQSAKRVNLVLEVGRLTSWDHGRGKDTLSRSGGDG